MTCILPGHTSSFSGRMFLGEQYWFQTAEMHVSIIIYFNFGVFWSCLITLEAVVKTIYITLIFLWRLDITTRIIWNDSLWYGAIIILLNSIHWTELVRLKSPLIKYINLVKGCSIICTINIITGWPRFISLVVALLWIYSNC